MGNNFTSFPKSNSNVNKLRDHSGVIIAFFVKDHDIKTFYTVRGSWPVNVGMEMLPFQMVKTTTVILPE